MSKIKKESMELPTIEHEGDTWRILNTGAFRDGCVICHLASTTRYRKQRNGDNPIHMTDLIDAEAVEQALNRPRGFFSWNRSLQGAFMRGERDQRDGAEIVDCPYADKRKKDGRLTWSRAYRAAWRDGFQHAESETNTENRR